ncbi:MAG: multicopper oxidase domain-containing protein [Phycisphaeraceae bacterium]|nr:multicopper oxidase domain-containing protein [Phycisphaerales bacterium]MCB9861397.1 multicopper oxidase domain-containing protein [Phycisphaeraceae bacterium]
MDLNSAFVSSNEYSCSFGFFDGNPSNDVPSNLTTNPILWRSDMFTVDWDRSGEVAWTGSGQPMSINWVTLIHDVSGAELFVCNTQLRKDNGTSEQAQTQQSQAMLLARTIKAHWNPAQTAVIAGNMNASLSSPTMKFLLDGEELAGETFSVALTDVEGSRKTGSSDYMLIPATQNLDVSSVGSFDTGSAHDLLAATLDLGSGHDASVAAGEGRAFVTPPLYQGELVGGFRVFDLEMMRGATRFYPFTVDTPTAGYNGSYLGPTLEVRKGEQVRIRVTNHLGDHDTTTHWHGLHVPGDMDGGPHQTIHLNETWEAVFPILNRAATCWYHPHPHAMMSLGGRDPGGTAQQVYEGLAGMFIIRDDETDQLAIPQTYGEDEFPLVLQDKSFNPDGTLFHLFPAGSGQIALRRGGSFLVNGVVSAEQETPAQVIRFRVVNGSNARFYNLGIDDGRSFYQIGSDGGMLTAPVKLTRLLIGPGERMDVLIDFSSDLGQRVTLRSYNSELGTRILPDMFADTWDRSDFDIMDFDVTNPTKNALHTIPASLIPVETIPETEAHNLGNPRPFLLSSNKTINFVQMSLGVINETINLNDTEIWKITNQTPMAHPFHVHGDSFQILTRDGVPPPQSEAGWKDTAVVEPGHELRIIKRFRDYADPEKPYMYHCHILEHEDDGMMGQFVVVDNNICYADCDQSGTLNIFDYICFGNLYAAQDPSADCDQNGLFDVFDFMCFQSSFALGCP